MKRHSFVLPALAALSSLALAGAAAAQSYPPHPPPYDPGPGASQDQLPYDDQGDPYYSDDPYQDQGSYDQQGYPDVSAYDNQGPVDVSLFYGELAPYGRWIERGRYGWVWEPTRVPVGWRPYSAGRWVETDYGWTWISAEPWGWATYHYGRWLLDPDYGWLWVPGTEWGPAWVSFQEGDGYIGWAPLPPSVGFRVGIGIQIGGLSLSAAIDPYAYSFVPERNFLDERLEGVVLPPARNVTFIRSTTNITNIRMDHDRVMNEGIPVQRIEQATGQRVRRFQLNESQSPARGRVAQVQGEQVTIFRPAVKLAQPRPNVTPPVILERRQQQRQAVQPQPSQPPNQPRQLPAPHLMPPQPGQQPGQPPANARPAPSAAELDRKHQAEQQRLQARQEAEQRRLQQLEERDNADRQAQGRAQEREAQHQAEQKALQEQHQREQQLLEARHQRERQATQARPQRKDQPDQRDQKDQQKRDKEREKKPEPPPPV